MAVERHAHRRVGGHGHPAPLGAHGDAPSPVANPELEGKIAVLISHRFSTVRMADRIAVIEGGQISELGSHTELLALGKAYQDAARHHLRKPTKLDAAT